MLGHHALMTAIQKTKEYRRRLERPGVNPIRPRPYLDVEPFDPKNVGPNSIDLTLSDEPILRVQKDALPVDILTRLRYIDLDEPLPTEPLPWREDVKGKFVILRPWTLYLASTAERTQTEGIVPQLAGRSSIGRRGLFVHVTAGFGDDGFNGRWTLELMAIENAIMLRPNRRICQVWFDSVEGESKGYTGQYQGQPGVVAPQQGVEVRTSAIPPPPLEWPERRQG